MKSILHKFLGIDKGATATATSASAPSSEATAAEFILPPPSTIENVEEHQKRALIGWIAACMARKLHMDQEQSGSLIYLSFSAGLACPGAKGDATQYLLYLASCLVEWVKLREDVYLKIKELQPPDHCHRIFLETYELVKEEIERYIPQSRLSEAEAPPPENNEIWQVYRDVIYAVTQQKFLLIERSEVERYREGERLCTAKIAERPDIPRARELAKLKLQEIGIPDVSIMSCILVVSEAITNILKHAREGHMTVILTDSTVNVLVEDSGPGFPLKLLPKTTLMAGYSTKKSLGQGFTLMMKMSEQVLLSTVPNEGSTLILMFKRERGGLSNDQSG